MPDINMPKLYDTMEEGTIVEWKKKSGEQVETGEGLAGVETDKETLVLEADADGVLYVRGELGVPGRKLRSTNPTACRRRSRAEWPMQSPPSRSSRSRSRPGSTSRSACGSS